MTSPPEQIEVLCPKCGIRYKDWCRRSLNLSLDDFDDDYIREASTSTCPECGVVVEHDVLVVERDGTWVLPESEPPE